jgi:DNA-binding NarL/FixJ family response regulator
MNLNLRLLPTDKFQIYKESLEVHYLTGLACTTHCQINTVKNLSKPVKISIVNTLDEIETHLRALRARMLGYALKRS